MTIARVLADPFAELCPALAPDDALLEAERCLECGGTYAPAPCVTACQRAWTFRRSLPSSRATSPPPQRGRFSPRT